MMTIDTFDIAENVLECRAGERGGCIKVDVSSVFPNVSKPVMGAYQNYLGCGVAGRIVGITMFHPDELETEKQLEDFHVLSKRIVAYYHSESIANDDYMRENFPDLEFNQKLPISAYVSR